jgi:hypothetical protein
MVSIEVAYHSHRLSEKPPGMRLTGMGFVKPVPSKTANSPPGRGKGWVKTFGMASDFRTHPPPPPRRGIHDFVVEKPIPVSGNEAPPGTPSASDQSPCKHNLVKTRLVGEISLPIFL